MFPEKDWSGDIEGLDEEETDAETESVKAIVDEPNDADDNPEKDG